MPHVYAILDARCVSDQFFGFAISLSLCMSLSLTKSDFYKGGDSKKKTQAGGDAGGYWDGALGIKIDSSQCGLAVQARSAGSQCGLAVRARSAGSQCGLAVRARSANFSLEHLKK